MTRASRATPVTRAAFVVGIIAWAPIVCRLLVACIIADPPPSPPTLPAEAPMIVQSSVVPPRPWFSTWPSAFEVPVSNPAPAQAFSWAFSIDYSAQGPPGNGNVISQYSQPPEPDGGLQVVEVPLGAPDSGGCHTVEFLLGPNDTTVLTPQTATDSVVWTYAPEGLGVCPPFDGSAYVDAALPPMADGFTPPIVNDK
jgi:hypothetical protein